MDGHTYDPTPQERATNEVDACLELCELYPGNTYWENRLLIAIREECKALADPESITVFLQVTA